MWAYNTETPTKISRKKLKFWSNSSICLSDISRIITVISGGINVFPKHLPNQDYFFVFIYLFCLLSFSPFCKVLNLEIISNEHINTDLTYGKNCYSIQLKLPVHRSGSLPSSWACFFFWCRSVKRTSLEKNYY